MRRTIRNLNPSIWRTLLLKTKIIRKNVSLKDLLRDPIGVIAFNKYLESELSSENLSFYLLCKKYESVMTTELQEKVTNFAKFRISF